MIKKKKVQSNELSAIPAEGRYDFNEETEKKKRRCNQDRFFDG